MSLKRLTLIGIAVGAVGVFMPAAASAQSFGFSISSGYPPPVYYREAPRYYPPAYDGDGWRYHEWRERQEARERYWRHERWEEQQEAHRHYWRDEHREHRWHDDEGDDD